MACSINSRISFSFSPSCFSFDKKSLMCSDASCAFPIGGVDPAARDYILNTIITNYNENATILMFTFNSGSLIVDKDFSAAWREKTVNEFDKCCLSASVRTKKSTLRTGAQRYRICTEDQRSIYHRG